MAKINMKENPFFLDEEYMEEDEPGAEMWAGILSYGIRK